MNNIFELAAIIIAGFATGVFFFGTLWFTVQRGVISKAPALWFVTSFVLRMAITLAAFYVLTAGVWQRVLICLFGFLIARIAVTSFTKNKQLTNAREE